MAVSLDRAKKARTVRRCNCLIRLHRYDSYNYKHLKTYVCKCKQM
nr:MAG TPA: hypothetical protein [Caudoviricetes sp.]